METERREVQILEATVEEINAALRQLCLWIVEIRQAVAALQKEPPRS